MMADGLPLLPVRALAELPGGPTTLVLCPTARLAAGLRRAHGEIQAGRGLTVWAALGCATPAQWLDHAVSSALLRGEIPVQAAAGTFLTRPQERCLWEQAVATDEEIAGGELFDRAGMALAAMEAENMRLAWRLDVPEAMQTDEFEAFSRWRERVATACKTNGWRTAMAAMAWRIDCITRGIGGLPAEVGVFGFVAADPMLSRLLAALEARGVELFQVKVGTDEAALAAVHGAIDVDDECRLAAAWVAQRLAENPQARLRIAVADWPVRRRLLESALVAALTPDAIGAGWAGLEPPFAAAGGTPLMDEPGVLVALQLLGLFAHPQRVAQADFGALLCAPGWSADVTEADGRARLEAALRERLPPEATLERFRRAVQRLAGELAVPQLAIHLDVLTEAPRAALGRQLPGAWGRRFVALLEALGWPGQRPLLVRERAGRDQLIELLAGLTTLDAVVGRIDAGAALRLAQQMARDLSLVAPRRTAPSVELCTLTDALAGPVDGLWLLGMNEGVWPPAPRPNPLLPAELQRRAGIPTARADSLAEQARVLQTLWCQSAGEVVFSWAGSEGERALRPSPLVVDMVKFAEVDESESGNMRKPFGLSLSKPGAGFDKLSPNGQVSNDRGEISERLETLERLDDSRAPVLAVGERVRGGTALLQAQAVCPAWGFYQYRLGAAVLPAPTFGLDARARGGLLHGALEAFWRDHDLAWLLGLDALAREAAIAAAVAAALTEFDQHAIEPLSPRLAALEVERLRALLATWLEVEAARADFRVLACEQKHTLDIEGLPVRVVVDRIDELKDGRLVVIDYKSGRSVSADSWADPRPSEPQLPIYAALAFPDQAVAAVVLARVTKDEPAFLGVAESDDLLPGVKTLENQRKRYAEDEFPDWLALRELWAERIVELAREVREGCAAVVFADAKDIAYCEVKPLLRVAERRAQWEAQ
jgi:exodeoxyribonuclease-5